MRDYHFPAAVTIPAALGLVGVLWLLRRKNSSNEGGRSHKTLPNEKDCTLKQNIELKPEQQIQHSDIEGITISQRKIPESLSHDQGSFDVNKSADVISQVKPVSEMLDSQHKMVVVRTHITQDDPVGSRSDMSHSDQVESLPDISPVDLCVGRSSVTPGGQDGGVTSVITQFEHSDSSASSAISHCDKSCILQASQGDGLVLSPTTQDDQGDELAMPLINQDSQGDGLAMPLINQDSQGDGLALPLIQDGQEDVLASRLTTQDGQEDVLASPLTTQDGQEDVLVSPLISQDGQVDGFASSLITHDSQGDGFASPPITQDGQGDGLVSSLITRDGHQDVLEPSLIIQDGQGDGPISHIDQSDNLKSTKYVDSDSLRVYLEQQVVTAMGDGLKEAYRTISESSHHTLKQVLPELAMHDLSSRAEKIPDLKVAEDLVCRTAALESQTDHTLESDRQSRKLEEAECMQSPSKMSNSHTADRILEDSINKTDLLAALQTFAESSPEGVESSLLQPLDSPFLADSHVNIQAETGNELIATEQQDDLQKQSQNTDKILLEPAAQLTDNTSFEATENTTPKISNASVSSIKSQPWDIDKTKPSASSSWLQKFSSSSIDSFGPEEIEALWGLDSSIDNLDKELFFLDNDPLVLEVDTKSVLGQTSLLCNLDNIPSTTTTTHEDNHKVSQNQNVHRSGTNIEQPLSDKSPDDDSLAKANSPLGDNTSEGSNDSGRGGSEHDLVCQGGEALVHFEFSMPSELCGHFIGKHGKNINYLKSTTGAHVSLTKNPCTPGYQICQIVGTQAEVDDALSMVRRQFPLQDYPLLTMVAVNTSVEHPLSADNQFVFPEVMQMSLPEGVTVDVFVSAVVDAGQVFVQQPTHRSYMSLEKMNYFLNLVYGQDQSVPNVPLPIESGIICVCESEGFWYRAMIMSTEDENGEVQVKFLDYGGYVNLPVSALKQIRADFMTLPFQAVECFMANLTPNQDEKFFSAEATQALSDMTLGKLLQCQVVARTDYGAPYIHLYQINSESNSAVLINQALVNSQLVRWVEIL